MKVSRTVKLLRILVATCSGRVSLNFTARVIERFSPAFSLRQRKRNRIEISKCSQLHTAIGFRRFQRIRRVGSITRTFLVFINRFYEISFTDRWKRAHSYKTNSSVRDPNPNTMIVLSCRTHTTEIIRYFLEFAVERLSCPFYFLLCP